MQPHAETAVDAVEHLVAVQAENPSQSAWAVAARTTRPAREEARAALVDAQLVAGMKRTIAADRATFTLTPHRSLRPRELSELRRATVRYGEYLGVPAALEVV